MIAKLWLRNTPGKERWSFDPRFDVKLHYSESLVLRGVSSWTDRQAGSDRLQAGRALPAGGGTPCRRRIFFASLDARLHSLDAATGQPCAGFGKQGQVDLKVGVGEVEQGEYEVQIQSAGNQKLP